MSEDPILYEAPPHASLNGHGTVMRLSALDRLFQAEGTVVIQCGTRQVTLPIQSVDIEFVEGICRPHKPKPKVHVELSNGTRRIVENLVDSEYQDKLGDYNRLFSYAFVLTALLCDVADRQGKVVWSADNTVHDLLAARDVLRDAMGIVDSQLATILNAVTALTQVVEERQVEG